MILFHFSLGFFFRSMVLTTCIAPVEGALILEFRTRLLSVASHVLAVGRGAAQIAEQAVYVKIPLRESCRSAAWIIVCRYTLCACAHAEG